MSDHTHDIKKEIKVYLLVFGALAVGTVITVALSYAHFPLPLAISVALLVATIKASLVACYFMHLISERKLIYVVLIIAGIAILGLPLSLVYNYHDVLEGTVYVP